MSLGNNRFNPNGLDNFIERLNKGLSKLLGKKDRPTKPQETSNITFAVIILISCMVLWFCTGFYFLGENEYGLIFVNGRIVDVKHGIRVGMSLPYPFGDAEIIDGTPGKVMNIGLNPANNFIVLDKNLVPVSVTAQFNYKITNPKILFLNHLQDQDEINNEIVWQVQSKIANFIANRDIKELETTNLTVLSNDIRKLVATPFDSYGITMVKFTILSLQKQDLMLTVPLPKSDSSGIKSDSSVRKFGREVNRDRFWMDD